MKGTVSGLELIEVRRSELAANVVHDWQDPELIAAPTAAKRQALLTNPLKPPADDVVQIIGIINRRVVGRLDSLAGELRMRGMRIPVIWASHMHVSPEFRGLGIGYRLLSHASSVHHTVCGCGVARTARSLYRRLNWTELRTHRRLIVTRPRPFVSAFLGDVLGRLMAPVLGLPLRLMHWAGTARSRRRLGGLNLCELTPPRPDVDALFDRSSPEVSGHRSMPWLQWLTSNCFFEGRRIFTKAFLLSDQLDTPVAYLLLMVRRVEREETSRRRAFQLGVFADWRIFEPNRLHEMDVILLGTSLLRAQGVDGVVVPTLDPVAASKLLRLGYAPWSDLVAVFTCTKDSPLNGIHERSRWRIAPADGDNFFS